MYNRDSWKCHTCNGANVHEGSRKRYVLRYMSGRQSANKMRALPERERERAINRRGVRASIWMHVLISLSLSFLSFSFYCLYNNLLIATGRTSEWPRLPLDDESRAGRASPPPYLRDGNRIAIRNITYVDYFYAAFYRVLYCHPPEAILILFLNRQSPSAGRSACY